MSSSVIIKIQNCFLTFDFLFVFLAIAEIIDRVNPDIPILIQGEKPKIKNVICLNDLLNDQHDIVEANEKVSSNGNHNLSYLFYIKKSSFDFF